MHYLERSCEIQVAAQGGGAALALPPRRGDRPHGRHRAGRRRRELRPHRLRGAAAPARPRGSELPRLSGGATAPARSSAGVIVVSGRRPSIALPPGGPNELDQDQGRHGDLLQGLGHRPADRLLTTAGRCQPTTGTPRCSSSSRRAFASSPTTGAAMAARARPPPATRWTPTPPTLATLTEAAGPARCHPRRPLHRRRRSRALRRPTRHEAGRQGGADRRRAAGDAQVGRQSGRPADRGVRRHPRRRRRQPRAVLHGPDDAVLRLQPAGRQGLRRRFA